MESRKIARKIVEVTEAVFGPDDGKMAQGMFIFHNIITCSAFLMDFSVFTFNQLLLLFSYTNIFFFFRFNSIYPLPALANYGSAAFRTKDTALCRVVMSRALYIVRQIHGDNSREVMLQRAKMMTFGLSEGETAEGYTQEEYEDYVLDQVPDL